MKTDARESTSKALRVFVPALVAAVLATAGFAIYSAEPAKVPAGIDPNLASQYFKEAKAISDSDGGAMWGVPLYGAMLFVDPETRQVVANRPDYKEMLKESGKVFAGLLPKEESIANTSLKWGGVEWTMVRWPLPDNRLQRDVLMIHESFHRIQDQLGLGGPDSSCDHLDTAEGRAWTRFEWRALSRALEAPKQAERQAIEDALVFRAYRRSLFKEAASRERALEMHEGLPEYTGVALGARNRSEARAYAIAELRAAPSFSTFVRSFAYATGPAYGLLLDEFKPEWRKGLKAGDDLAAILSDALGVTLPADLKPLALKRADSYGGKGVMAEEESLAQKKALEKKELLAKFVEGPVLFLPTASYFTYSFDPTNQVPIEGAGTVYPYLRVSAAWGIFEAKRGALLLMKDGYLAGVQVPAPKATGARPLAGDGWTLSLNDGWVVVGGERKGDYKLVNTKLPPP